MSLLFFINWNHRPIAMIGSEQSLTLSFRSPRLFNKSFVQLKLAFTQKWNNKNRHTTMCPEKKWNHRCGVVVYENSVNQMYKWNGCHFVPHETVILIYRLSIENSWWSIYIFHCCYAMLTTAFPFELADAREKWREHTHTQKKKQIFFVGLQWLVLGRSWQFA